ncbi:MAG: hypothetical protein OEY52_03900 [Gammaproteobacteria bacterium]|nr:hypothetical protein [Gammaproteobacteria bacterium]
MHRPLFAITATCLLLINAWPALADTLSVPEPKQETFSITLPGRGMSMAQVEDKFGEPQEKNDAVGTPPITTWIYDGFTVYFEDRFVIHAVFHKPK